MREVPYDMYADTSLARGGMYWFSTVAKKIADFYALLHNSEAKYSTVI